MNENSFLKVSVQNKENFITIMNDIEIARYAAVFSNTQNKNKVWMVSRDFGFQNIHVHVSYMYMYL